MFTLFWVSVVAGDVEAVVATPAMGATGIDDSDTLVRFAPNSPADAAREPPVENAGLSLGESDTTLDKA